MGDVPASYSIVNLNEAEDFAAKYGYSEQQEARFPAEALDAEQTGLAHIRVKPGMRQPFAHRHGRAEEIYVVLRGSGKVRLDDDVIEVRELDAIRISPSVTRAFEAGADGLELLAFGPRHPGDAEMVPAFWAD
jgi:mannose-6-phosphate isomerase-like protein (cupin superfamily)